MLGRAANRVRELAPLAYSVSVGKGITSSFSRLFSSTAAATDTKPQHASAERILYSPTGMKVTLTPITPERLEEALDFTVEYFQKDEPLNNILGQKYKNDAISAYMKDRGQAIMDAGLSYMALTPDGRMVGAFTSCTQRAEEEALERSKFRVNKSTDAGFVDEMGLIRPTYEDVKQLFKELYENIPLPEDTPEAPVIHALCAAVSPDVRGFGLMMSGLGFMLEQARYTNFRYAVSECTMDFSTRGLYRLGGKCVNFIEYKSWKCRGKNVLASISEEHKGISLFVLDLQSPDFNPRPTPLNPPKP